MTQHGTMAAGSRLARQYLDFETRHRPISGWSEFQNPDTGTSLVLVSFPISKFAPRLISNEANFEITTPARSDISEAGE
ncbi:hypothetical protein [Bosea sp. Tri-44]|uniref:hypothetical protein n=1 Tax=Bosea sp. Tri-44 TaxID=1972137 RepID=UPI00100EF0A0|nr:hypothetical protein [Bosea sp. Tri-44]